mgnify:CR=1 FL=1
MRIERLYCLFLVNVGVAIDAAVWTCIVLADVGAFGGEIATPHIDRLAADGLRMTGFHVAATCSPTRAMLMTGVDHHRAGLANMQELITPAQQGHPGYLGHLDLNVPTVAERLRTAAQSLDAVPASGIGVGGDVEAFASDREPEGGKVIGGQRRDHRHAGHHVRERQDTLKPFAGSHDRHGAMDRKSETDRVAEQSAECATGVVDLCLAVANFRQRRDGFHKPG